MFNTQLFSARTKTLFVFALLTTTPAPAAEIVYQEGFNTDGEPSGRYTFTGRNAFELTRIQDELGIFDQKGPLYWAHSSDVSFVGNPNIPARRMIFTWRTNPNRGAATEDVLDLWDSSVNWMLNGKASATIVVFPNVAAINELADRLTAAGHTVVDDDPQTYPDERDVPGDLFIHAPGATANPSRFAMVPKPVIVMEEPNYDDMLVGSIGTFAPGLGPSTTNDTRQVTIAAPGHPAAGGKTGTFIGFNTTAQPFALVGSFLPPGAITLATVTRVIPPAVNSLADVDAMIAGTKQHEMTAGTVADIDFSDASPGQWFVDNAIPGGYAGNWGLRVQGKITVSAAGTYRFALGSADGARLQIDRDKNGFTAADTILEDLGPHAHQIVYADVNFAAAGTYDLEVRSYNSGSVSTQGSLEVSVSNVEVPVPDDALDSGFWENLSVTGTAIKLESDANVTAYNATGPNVEAQTPLIVLLNGPTDTPPGSFYDGGAFTGFEGTAFIGGAGLNKFETAVDPKTLTLRPVSVAGKTNVQLRIALAATQVDFETSDYLDIYVFPNGAASTPVRLAHFRGVQNAVQPWLADEMERFVRKLTKQFADFTYDIPAGATDLIVEFRAFTSWWTEILALDNIRITAGAAGELPTISVAKQGNNVVLTIANGTLERATGLEPPIQWQPVSTTGGTHTIAPGQQLAREFFRAKQ